MTRTASFLLAACLLVGAAARAQTVVAQFDPTKLELPEQLAFDGHTGDVYVSFLLIGQIAKITPDGEQTRIAVPPGAFLTAGVVFNDESRKLYVLLSMADPAQTGVYELQRDGSWRLYSHVAGGTLNGLTANSRGEMFLTDSLTGFVWKVPAGGGEASLWADLLAPGLLTFPGSNGIKMGPGERDVYVAISNQQRIVRIPILLTGAAGVPVTYASGPDLLPDDFAFDVEGNLYIANEPTTNITRIRPDGTHEVLWSGADGLTTPSAVMFGKHRHHDDLNLYVTSAGLQPGLGNGPSLMKFPNAIAGLAVAKWAPRAGHGHDGACDDPDDE